VRRAARGHLQQEGLLQEALTEQRLDGRGVSHPLDAARTFRYAKGVISSRKALRFALLRLLPVVALVVAVLWSGSARAGEKLKVLVPEKDNLQYLAFWVAKGGGYFEREGIDIELVVPPPASRFAPPVDGVLEKGEADAAVLAPYAYLRMIAAKAPIVLVANLSRNDPYALVVRPEVSETRKVNVDGPIKDRLLALKGLTIAVVPAAFGRLRALLESQGLDIEKDVSTVPLLARDQLTPFKDKSTDAAYLATPSLEKAIVAGDAIVVVNQARSEVPALANRQSHVLGVTQRVWNERREVVAAAVRAIAEAEKRIHAAQPEVVDVLARELPGRDRRELETAVKLYEPGVPERAAVSMQDIAPALALVPESIPKPELAGIDLAPFVAPDLASRASDTSGRTRWIAIGGVAVVVAAIAIVMKRRRPTKSTLELP
jgi:ABC-type nitrate/sulfonate/bicarbonate transport system substrate-binding protein